MPQGALLTAPRLAVVTDVFCMVNASIDDADRPSQAFVVRTNGVYLSLQNATLEVYDIIKKPETP